MKTQRAQTRLSQRAAADRPYGPVCRQPQRSGFFSLELAFTLPILGIILLGLFEFSFLFFARGSVVEASRVGARKACLAGVRAEDVEMEIQKVLQPRFRNAMRVDVQFGEESGDVVAVAVRVPMDVAAPDLLWPIGYSLKERNLYSETRMIKE